MSFSLIDTKELEKIQNDLYDLKCILTTMSLQKEKAETDWIPLKKFLADYGIGKTSWYEHYRNVIKHRNDGIKIWVYRPSMEKYLMEKAIN